jgi:hypothetical protein
MVSKQLMCFHQYQMANSYTMIYSILRYCLRKVITLKYRFLPSNNLDLIHQLDHALGTSQARYHQ